MSSRIPDEACVVIGQNIRDFILHKLSWEDLLDRLQDEINILVANSYAIGYHDAKESKAESPTQIDDWRWRLQIGL